MSDKYLVEISLLYDNLIKVKKILVGKIIIRGFRKIFCKSVSCCTMYDKLNQVRNIPKYIILMQRMIINLTIDHESPFPI